MTIKELEQRSGLERANIRFYEKEGLFHPVRQKNGYRDYSEEDLQILLKIKLLRSLHISLEEIRALEREDISLNETLQKKLQELEEERQSAALAQDICRKLRSEQATFQTMDAGRYLSLWSADTSRPASAVFPSAEEDREPYNPHPWRRFFARMLDLTLWELPLYGILGFVFQVNLSHIPVILQVFLSFAVVLILYFTEPLFLSRFGTTPGKALLGISLTGSNGEKLSYGDALERTGKVIGSGLGYGIPVYQPWRLWKSYIACRENKLSWDDSYYDEQMVPLRWYHVIRSLAGQAAVMGILALLLWLQLYPPCRGPLTEEAFLTNYRYYERYYGVDGEDFQLFSSTIPLVYEYQTDDSGILQKVTITMCSKDFSTWAQSGNLQMYLSALAFVNGQAPDGPSVPINQITDRLYETIYESKGWNFRFEENQIRISCERTYEDCYFDGYLIFPGESGHSSYEMTFIMKRVD